MRLVIPAALLFGLAVRGMAQADEFPYEAFVAADEAEVVAGPGHRFYVTDRLPRGTKVEIYREEPSGWLAIRPPDGSFSWVPGDFVERLDNDHLGRVTEAAGAWVGTSIEHVSQHHQQLTLTQGELVQILGEKTVVAASGREQAWLKIAPPAGEYRWIHLRDVSRQKPPEQMPRIEPEVEAEPEPVAAAISRKEKESREEPRRFSPDASAIALRDLDQAPARYIRTVEPAQFRTSPIVDGRAASPDGFVARKRRDGDSVPQVASAPIRTVTTPVSGPRLDSDTRLATAASNPVRSSAGLSTSRLSADEIASQLDLVEVDLSLMVAQERSQWNFADLKRRVESLVEAGSDPASRGRARLMLDKIKQFDDTFSRDAHSGRASSSAAVEVASPKTEPISGSLADPRYDAQGWLKPVVSRKSDKPVAPFAVVDADGQPICFVSPSPGLNLHRYENKQVGLYGRRGYLESLKKPHLLAERVIELDSRWR
jgi:hypothetical protein